MKSISQLKVLELGNCASGAVCAKLFAGFGASVYWIADETLSYTAEERAWFNTGKHRLEFDWRADIAADRLARLFECADVVIDSLGVDRLAKLGLDARSIATRWPGLVLCQLTPFGQDGPYRDFLAEDITLYAMSGAMNQTGHGAREPLNAQPRIARLSAGLNAYVACFMALLRRERYGEGEVIDVSMHEAAMENLEVALADFLQTQKIARRNDDNHALVPWRTYPCKDGTATVIGGPVRNWLKAATMFGQDKLLEPPLDGLIGRIEHREAFEALLKPWLAQRTREEVFHAGQEQGLAWGYVASVTEALAFPQFAERGFFVEHENAQLGTHRMPGAPYRGAACHWKDLPAPDEPESFPHCAGLWEKGHQVWRRLKDKPDKKPPLAGIRILDFTHDWAGPHTTRLLADYGADVIKVEYPKRLDIARGARKALINEHPRFWTLHRGKRSVTLDLKDPGHLHLCEQLVRETDVVIENSRPGVMARKGFWWDRLRSLNPKIIRLSMSGYGQDGPIERYAGYGGGLEGLSGLQSLTAYDADGPRYRVREMDVLNSIVPAGAVVAALWHRKLTGEGQFIDFSELEGCAWYIGEFFVQASREGRDPEVLGNRHRRFAPQGCYACAGLDRWIVLSIRSDEEWRRLADRIGGAARDARLGSVEQRRAAHAELDHLIGAWTATRDAKELMHELQTLGIAAGQTCNAADLAADPHLAARGWFWDTPQGRYPGVPFRFRDGGAIWRGRGPNLGEHNAEIFAACGTEAPLPDLSPDNIGTGYEKS